MTPVDKRLELLERRVAQQDREIVLLKKEARQAMPLAPRHGRIYGVTHQDFTKGTDDFITVEVWLWSTSAEEWQASGTILEDKVRDWFLNDGEIIERGTKVRCDYYESTWLLTAVYCSPSDDADVIASLPSEE